MLFLAVITAAAAAKRNGWWRELRGGQRSLAKDISCFNAKGPQVQRHFDCCTIGPIFTAQERRGGMRLHYMGSINSNGDAVGFSNYA